MPIYFSWNHMCICVSVFCMSPVRLSVCAPVACPFQHMVARMDAWRHIFSSYIPLNLAVCYHCMLVHHRYICRYKSTGGCLAVCLSVCLSVSMYVYMYLCMYVCVCVDSLRSSDNIGTLMGRKHAGHSSGHIGHMSFITGSSFTSYSILRYCSLFGQWRFPGQCFFPCLHSCHDKGRGLL